nr:biopolymer transporter ExbD [Coleofasciculus sp. LEGE 07092]
MDATSEDVRIELIPLIDVIFCILTFFILAAVGLSRQQAISVDLPKAATGTPQGQQILMVSLDELGQVYVEKDPVITREDFIQKLRDYRQKNPQGTMALYASPNASYNEVVQVLDLLREVGGARVALATSPGENPQVSPDINPYGMPPGTGVPGFIPLPGQTLPGQIPGNPDGTFNPYSQPQLPGNLGQPELGLPGTSPANPGQPELGLPGTSPANPGQSQPKSSGTNSNTPQPSSPNAESKPSSSPVPNSGATTTPKQDSAAPQNNTDEGESDS